MMSEVRFSSITAPDLNHRDLIKNKSFKNSYSFISPAENAFVKSEGDNKEIYQLKKTVNRLEQNMSFLQHEHCQMLEGLQKQIDKLREENHDLQFQLVMRSDRSKDSENKNSSKINDQNISNSKLVSDHILCLKQALIEEKRKNKELLNELELLKNSKNDLLTENSVNDSTSETPVSEENNLYISPDIRVSFNPLIVSTYQHDSGLYLVKTPLTVQDCEMVIQSLVQKLDSGSALRENSASTRSLSGGQRLKFIPGIKKQLQPIKPTSRGSTIVKLNPLGGHQSSKPIGLTSTQKLMPILTQKSDNAGPEHESTRNNASRKSDRDSKAVDNLSIYTDYKTGSSLPALPKPNDYNQAEKQKRLHLLQRKRLDQYNNRS